MIFENDPPTLTSTELYTQDFYGIFESVKLLQAMRGALETHSSSEDSQVAILCLTIFSELARPLFSSIAPAELHAIISTLIAHISNPQVVKEGLKALSEMILAGNDQFSIALVQFGVLHTLSAALVIYTASDHRDWDICLRACIVFYGLVEQPPVFEYMLDDSQITLDHWANLIKYVSSCIPLENVTLVDMARKSLQNISVLSKAQSLQGAFLQCGYSDCVRAVVLALGTFADDPVCALCCCAVRFFWNTRGGRGLLLRRGEAMH